MVDLLMTERGQLRALLHSSGRRLWHFCVKGPAQGLSRSIERVRYRELWRRQLTHAQANARISQLLASGAPFLVSRIGQTEGRILGESLFYANRFRKTTKKQAHQNAGVFPVTPDLLAAVAEVYAESIGQADLLGFWHTAHQVRLLAERYPAVSLAPLPSLEPYLHGQPWSEALRGRRVLVVHPFTESIFSQYCLNREKLFDNPRVLPEFDLQVLAPPQTLAPLTAGYASWLDALDHLIARTLQQDFDVALLGCGAYGLPLGAAIKASGRQAIHLGGALQVLFGIRGRRWEAMPEIAALMNDAWVRPSLGETPSSASFVEQACYW